MADGQFERTIAVMDGIFSEVETARGAEATLSAKIATKQDALTVGTNLDGAPTADSTNPVTSGGTKTAIDGVPSSMRYGENIPAGTAASPVSLDSYTTPGVYRCTSGATCKTLTNKPISESAFRLEVYPMATSGRYMQILHSGAASLYKRAYTAGGWGSWYKFEGTEVANVAPIYPNT